MTLILSRSSYRFVLQLSDRLITQDSVQFDPTSNKTIVFFAFGGIASLSYTGIAFVGDLPTDQWIAQYLTDCDLSRFDKPPAMRSWGPPRKVDFGLSLYNLAGQLSLIENYVRDKQWLASWIAQPFEIAINGYQWNSRGDVRPIIAWIEKPAHAATASLAYADRNWWVGKTVSIGATPSGHVDHPSIEAIAEDLRGADPDQAEAVLARALADVASRSPRVGSDMMSILITPPYTGFARVKFMSSANNKLVLRGRGRAIVLPTAFTPWFAGPSSLHAPSLISHSYEVALGPYLVRVVGPSTQSQRAVISGQRRPAPPTRRR